MDFKHSDDTNVQGMRITVPEKGVEIFMLANMLPQDEMEKILLSMVEKK